MVSYRTVVWIAIISIVVYYAFVQKHTFDYQISVDIDASCSAVFSRISEVGFIREANDKVIKTEVLSVKRQNDTTIVQAYVAENIGLLVTNWELGFEFQMNLYHANHTITLTASPYGYCDSFSELVLVDTDDTQCRVTDTHTLSVPVVFKTFTKAQAMEGHTSFLQNTKTILESDRQS